MRHTFANQQLRQRTEELLQARPQGPNESVTTFVEDVFFLMNRADPNAPEAKKLRLLLRGVRENVFGSLLWSPPITARSFIREATNIEGALNARTSDYQRLPGFAALSPSSCNTPDIHEIIRDVVQEEIELLPAGHQPFRFR